MDDKKTAKKSNIDNLRPPQSAEEARARGRNGGIASGESRRRSKTFREVFSRLLDYTVSDGVTADLHKTIETDYPTLTADEAIALAQIARAVKGDTAAAQFVRDTLGERPVDMVSATVDGGIAVTIQVIDTVAGDD